MAVRIMLQVPNGEPITVTPTAIQAEAELIWVERGREFRVGQILLSQGVYSLRPELEIRISGVNLSVALYDLDVNIDDPAWVHQAGGAK